MNQKDFDAAFPHGAAIFFDENTPVVDAARAVVREDEGRVLVLLWAHPNKDFYFDITAPVETEHGWRVKTLEGKPAFLSPQSPERGKRVRDALKEA